MRPAGLWAESLAGDVKKSVFPIREEESQKASNGSSGKVVF